MFFPPGSSMEEFFVLDSENCGLAGKMNGEKLVKKPSLGSAVRKRLSDITNSQHLPNSPIQDEKSKLISASTKDYIEQLHKENTALVRLLADRNKIIELTGVELTKMRINLQKVQEQNWHLAQANNKMLMELNLGKDRLKALTHELGCKVALLSAKNSELEETVNTRPCQRAHTEEVLKKCEETKGTSNHSRRRQSRVQGQSAVSEKLGVKEKEKADEKRQSAPVNCEQPESTEEKADNKRLCLRRQSARFKPEQQEEHTDEKADNKRLQSRRQSARFKSEQPVKQEEHTDEMADNKRPQPRRQSTRFKSEQPEPTEDLFEIEDAKFPVQPILDEPMQEDDPTNTSSIKEEIKGKGDTPVSQRSSIGRPTRKAAEKVQSYKERPVNIKLRRPE